MKYLKKKSTIGHQPFIKITDKKSIIIEKGELHLEYNLDDNIELTSGWYKENWQMTDATREEFDNEYKKAVKKLNEIASL